MVVDRSPAHIKRVREMLADKMRREGDTRHLNERVNEQLAATLRDLDPPDEEA